jgi:hypothetical protein
MSPTRRRRATLAGDTQPAVFHAGVPAAALICPKVTSSFFCFSNTNLFGVSALSTCGCLDYVRCRDCILLICSFLLVFVVVINIH